VRQFGPGVCAIQRLILIRVAFLAYGVYALIIGDRRRGNIYSLSARGRGGQRLIRPHRMFRPGALRSHGRYHPDQ